MPGQTVISAVKSPTYALTSKFHVVFNHITAIDTAEQNAGHRQSNQQPSGIEHIHQSIQPRCDGSDQEPQRFSPEAGNKSDKHGEQYQEFLFRHQGASVGSLMSGNGKYSLLTFREPVSHLS